MGMDEDLTVATQIAVQEMIDFLMETRDLERGAAYALAGIAADLRITQLVDGNVGVHMMIAKEIFPQAD
jgi:acetamidase/formamidase